MFEQLNKHKYIDLLEIEETEDWCFRLVIAEACVSTKLDATSIEKEANEGIKKLLSESCPIEVTEKSKKYEIIFDDYITYSCINESYASLDENEIFEGKLARVYSKSRFLDYVASSTFATQDYPGPFNHYGFRCLNHIVDVASMERPRILEINA